MKLIFVPFLLISSTLIGQVNQVWLDINLQHNINDRWSWLVDAGPRFTLQQSLSVTFARGGFIYKLRPQLELMGGVGYFLYNSSPSGITGNELRPWQGVRFNYNLSRRVLITNYTRLEQRMIFSDDADDFFLRFRNLTGITVTVFENREKTGAVYLPISFEFFEDLNKKLFINRHRTYIGTGYAFLRSRIEVHYISQQGRLNTSDDFRLTENIYRVRWFVTL